MASRSIKNRASIKKKQPWIFLLYILAIFVAVVLAGGVGLYALGTSWLEDLPDYESADAFNTSLPSEVYAGDTLLARFQLENREPVAALDQISPYVIKGTIATEDERYYDHGGFDVMGVARAAVVNLTGMGQEGASTITQQFVRNTILAKEMDEISFKRKIREMYLSVKLEEKYTKDEILLMYLNTINYGSGAYGIEAAAKRYFSKPATELSLIESATLIGIPQSPSYNNPIDNPDNCVKRRNLVLSRMLRNGYITQEEHDVAKEVPLELNQTLQPDGGIYAYPHIVRYVKNQLTTQFSEDEILKGGLRIETTLDVMQQQEAEAAVSHKLDGLPSAIDGSLVAIDPSTGHIKAMVGGDSEVNLATGEGGDPNAPGRPCGSSFKVFTLVAALEAGINPQTMLDCSSPATLPEAGYPASASLNNIDRHNYGTINIQRAFAKSSNTGFVRLQMSVGIGKVIETAQRMGITSPLNEIGSLTLGTMNVTMLDMASAYATIANGGVRNDPSAILRVLDKDGKVIVDNSVPGGETATTKSERVLSPEIAHAATEIMKTVVNSYDGTGRDAALSNGQPVAAKTGTSSDYMDITFCGITPQMSVAVWLGDPQNTRALPAHTGAGDVFRNFMNAILYGQDKVDFPDAGDPEYQAKYTDAKYHVGSYGWSSSGNSGSSGSNNSNNAQEEEPDPAPTPTPTPDPPTPTPDPDPPVPPSPGGGGTAPAA